jgi:hypothetical protein
VLAAAFEIKWRNPKIHLAPRTKSWLACQEHLEFLVEYLKARDFYLETVELI